MDVSTRARNIANLVNLSTPLGLLAAAIGRGHLKRLRSLIVADHVRLPLVTASAMTIGDVVLVFGRSVEDAQALIPGLLAHEEEHSWQYSYCLGLPFLPLYFASVGWSWLRSGDRASANHFERQAGLAMGGYPEREKRPLKEGVTQLRGLVARRR